MRDQDPLWKTYTRYKRAEIERAVFYHYDQVGTPQVLSNESGEQVCAVTLDTWGQALEIKASDHLLEQTNIRFQGQYFDAETGLHYNRYRYYEPHRARYIGKDPIGLDGGINTSAYVSDPNAWIDPLGLMGNKKDDRGLFGLSDSVQSKNQQELNKTYNTNPKKTKTNLEWMSSDNGYPRQPKVVLTPAPAPTQEIPRSIYVPQTQSSPGILGFIAPTLMSGYAKDNNTRYALKQQGQLRKITTTATTVAASTYVVAIGGRGCRRNVCICRIPD